MIVNLMIVAINLSLVFALTGFFLESKWMYLTCRNIRKPYFSVVQLVQKSKPNECEYTVKNIVECGLAVSLLQFNNLYLLQFLLVWFDIFEGNSTCIRGLTVHYPTMKKHFYWAYIFNCISMQYCRIVLLKN